MTRSLAEIRDAVLAGEDVSAEELERAEIIEAARRRNAASEARQEARDQRNQSAGLKGAMRIAAGLAARK